MVESIFFIAYSSNSVLIFYTKNTAFFFKSTKETDAFHTRLNDFLDVNSAVASDSKYTSHEQIELFDSCLDDDWNIYWVGFRLNDASRLIGAVVKNTTTKERNFFALEITLDHNYQKTLVGNTQRKKNWKTFMLDYLRHTLPAESRIRQINQAPLVAQPIMQYQGRFNRPDPKQIELMDIPLNTGAVCFGSPGTGKTLVTFHRAMSYVRAKLSTAVFFPTERLADAMRQEFLDQGIDGRDTGVSCLSFNAFLAQMSRDYPNLNLIYNPQTDRRKYVDFSFFKAWIDQTKKIKQVTKEKPETLWQEFYYVFMQPTWSNPIAQHLDLDSYLRLGAAQSVILQETRSSVYQNIFMPFLNHIHDTKQFYFPVQIAHQLFLSIRKSSQATELVFDAILLDEVQKFHPWQWACLLTVLKNPFSAGQFFISGDAHQCADQQPLRVSEPLRLYFEDAKADIPVYHLSLNHRNSQAVSRFVAQIHAMEVHLIGSMERDTHVDTQVNETGLEGYICSRPYNQTLVDNVSGDAGAYVLIPNDQCRAEAQSLWPPEQIVTLSEFAGMSASTVVMFGFSEYFKKTLDSIVKMLSSDSTLLSWQTPQPYARKAKGSNLDLTALRTCFQSIYTAASRAIDVLMVVEPDSRPHELFQIMFEATKKKSASLSVEVSCANIEECNTAMPVAQKSTQAQWFERAKKDAVEGLIDQAKAIFLREQTWGPKNVAELEKIMKGCEPKDLIETVDHILFPSPSKLATPKIEIQGRSLVPDVLQPEWKRFQMDGKWVGYIEKLMATICATNIKNLLKTPLPKLANILFGHKMESGYCLFVEITTQGKLKEFCREINPTLRSELESYYHTLNKKDIFCQLSWVLFCDNFDHDSSPCDTTPRNMAAKRVTLFFEEIFRAEPVDVFWEDAFLSEKWGYFLDIGLIAKHPIHELINKEGPLKGMTPFYLFLSSDKGLTYLKDNWDFCVKNHIVSSESMEQALTGSVSENGMSPFFLLIKSKNGLGFLDDKWDYFIKNKLISYQSLHQEVTGETINKGLTPFFYIILCPDVTKFIIKHWDDLVRNKLIDATQMHKELHSKITDKGTTPFFYLFDNTDGQTLLKKKWGDFLKHRLVSHKSMHKVVSNSKIYQDMTAFFLLISNTVGYKLIIDRWNDFEKNRLISATSMHQVIGPGSAHSGESPFFYLTRMQIGMELIRDKWDYFVANELLSKKSMHQLAGKKSRYKDFSPFYYFVSSTIGRKLIHDKWDYFVEKELITKKSMAQVVDAKGIYRGMPHFYLLIMGPEGLHLLRDKWDYFVALKLITAQAVEHIIRNCPGGYQLLLEKCDYLKERKLLSPALMKPILPVERPSLMNADPGRISVNSDSSQPNAASSIDEERVGQTSSLGIFGRSSPGPGELAAAGQELGFRT